MLTSQSPLVVQPTVGIVVPDVTVVTLPQLLNGRLNVDHPALGPHLLSGEVAVSPGTIPVSLNGLEGTIVKLSEISENIDF